MAATFSNPRWDALPCERMRGCSFADDFLTLKRSEQNDGVDSGSGNTADYGLTLTGSGWFVYDIVSQPSGFSVKIQFKTSATSSGASLIGNANIVVGPLSDGFEIWVDADGVRANHYDGVGLPSNCYVDLAYADGAIHTVTYVVDMVGGTHSLYVDALAVNTQTTTISTEIGTSAAISVGRLFAGTLYKARVFDALLTEAEHDVYHAGTLETFMVKPWAVFRCNDFNDDTDGHYAWDRTTALRDLEKADRVTSSKFPVLASVPTDHYVFDGVDDYLTNPLTLPTNYTITAAKAAAGYAGGTAYPVIQQDNDTTFLTDLITEGGYSGLLNSLIIHDKVLTPLELLQDQYQHMYWLWRGRAYGAVQRLIVEDVCKFALFLDYPAYPFTDYAGDVVGTPTLITGGGTDGALFASATSNVEFPDSAALESDELSISIEGIFTGSVAAGTIVDKGTDYKFGTNGNQLVFNGSTIAHTFSDNEQIGVTGKDGEKPRFEVDGVYIGEGSSTITLDPTDTTVLNIGNNNEKNSPTAYQIKQVHIFNKALTDV
jgi:hypothetical protein